MSYRKRGNLSKWWILYCKQRRRNFQKSW
jgi:hypothetical protein